VNDQLAVYTLIGTDSVFDALTNGGSGALQEGRRWVAVAQWLSANSGKKIPLMLANGSQITGVEWVGLIERIKVHESGTTVSFSNLRAIPKPIPLHRLIKASDNQPLDRHYRRPYVPCKLVPSIQKLVSSAISAPIGSINLLHDAATLEVGADPKCKNVSETTRSALISARIGQGEFRKQLMKFWESKCAVTGIAVEQTLVASHIKPWADSSNSERLDPFNGLLLSANLDKLFDKGMISFDDHGRLLISLKISTDDLELLGINADSKLRTIENRHAIYLTQHRKKFGFPS
jgi:hypothetical protein